MSYVQSDLLLAWRSGTVCCSICCNGNHIMFNHDGLQGGRGSECIAKAM